MTSPSAPGTSPTISLFTSRNLRNANHYFFIIDFGQSGKYSAAEGEMEARFRRTPKPRPLPCFRVHAEAPIHIVASCTERKRATIPEGLHLRSIEAAAPSVRVSKWWDRLTEYPRGGQLPAARLYGGEHWKLALESLQLLRDVGHAAELWAASAGYGLIPASAPLHPYSATFAQGTPDSVTRDALAGDRTEQLQAWWNALSEFRGPQEEAPRSLRALVSGGPHAPLLVVGSPDYIRAMRTDLLAARDALAVPDLLTIFSNHDLASDQELAPHLIPVDERSQTVLGGSMQGLNARVAHALLEWGRTGSLTAPRLKERYDAMVSDAEKPPKHNRERMDDKDVLAFLRAQLQQDPRAGWTLLLRTLRGGGRACEQGRFRELHKQVREELAAAGQQGLKLEAN